MAKNTPRAKQILLIKHSPLPRSLLRIQCCRRFACDTFVYSIIRRQRKNIFTCAHSKNIYNHSQKPQEATVPQKTREHRKTEALRKDALTVEITRNEKLGIWINAGGCSYFVAHDKTPWLKDQTVREMLNIRLLNGFHLRWESLGIDVDLDAFAGANR